MRGSALMELVRERRPHADTGSLRGTLDAATRATLSYILTPSEQPAHIVAGAMAHALSAAIRMDSEDCTHPVRRARQDAARNLVVVNAAAALKVGGLAHDLRDGARMAEQSIDSGAAMARLENLIQATNASGATI